MGTLNNSSFLNIYLRGLNEPFILDTDSNKSFDFLLNPICIVVVL